MLWVVARLELGQATRSGWNLTHLASRDGFSDQLLIAARDLSLVEPLGASDGAGGSLAARAPDCAALVRVWSCHPMRLCDDPACTGCHADQRCPSSRCRDFRHTLMLSLLIPLGSADPRSQFNSYG